MKYIKLEYTKENITRTHTNKQYPRKAWNRDLPADKLFEVKKTLFSRTAWFPSREHLYSYNTKFCQERKLLSVRKPLFPGAIYLLFLRTAHVAKEEGQYNFSSEHLILPGGAMFRTQ